jgi:pimeloyl-ACP methyl ester carboxylesterase
MNRQCDAGRAVRDGISLAYYEEGSREGSPIIFVHGFGCNAGHFRHQQHYFATSHRTVSVDLRGHGASDAPLQDYEVIGFADDLRFLCDHLGLDRPIVVGHSMGGNIALKLAVRYPEIVKAIVMIDTFIAADTAFMNGLRQLSETMPAMGGTQELYDLLSGMLFLPSDDSRVRNRIVAESVRTPWHVLTSAFAEHIIRSESVADLKELAVPAAYIGADGLPTEISKVEALNPRVITGKTVGVGHFSPLLAADQINAMLRSFIDRVTIAMGGA